MDERTECGYWAGRLCLGVTWPLHERFTVLMAAGFRAVFIGVSACNDPCLYRARIGTAVLVPGSVGLVLSALIFGLSVFMSPGAVTSFIRQNLPMQSWGPAISLFTVVFAIAQTIGPYAAGWLGDRTESIGTSLLAAAAVLLTGGMLVLLQKPLSQG